MRKKILGSFFSKKLTVFSVYTAHIFSYIGNWSGDLKHGKGEYRWANGNRYNGDYYEDKPHGSGIYSSVHGDNYVGKFANGLFQGIYIHVQYLRAKNNILQ